MSDYHENITAEQIREQMSYVRRELDDDVEQVVEDANSLGDLRAYVKAQPIGWVIASAVAGFMLVPSNRTNNDKSSSPTSGRDRQEEQQAEVAQGSMMGAALGAVATMGTKILLRKAADAGMGMFSAGSQPRGPMQPPTTTHSHYETNNG